MKELIFVSGDSHATPMPESWVEFVEKRYHDYLPSLHEDNRNYTEMLSAFAPRDPEVLAAIDPDRLLPNAGAVGLWDRDRRLIEMDREGVAAEIVFHGDPRAIPVFHSVANRSYPPEVNQAGVRAYHRWAESVFGGAMDRIFILAETGPCLDMDETLEELRWTKDHGFFGTGTPGQTGDPDLPPLYDDYWDRFWSVCVELGMPMFIHAGYGTEQGDFMGKMHQIRDGMRAAGRTNLIEEVHNTPDFFTVGLKARQAMWQLMLGGVFDRYPDFKVLLCEVRGDWLPDTLRHLDAVYERAAGSLPAQRKPSEYWQSNFMVCLSFMHRAEVDLRDRIGIDTIMFGRDYPHFEGTWPNTRDWLHHALAGVPEDEVRLILGDNAIRFLGLDRKRLAEIAARIGPVPSDFAAPTPAIHPLALANWDARGGYLKPAAVVDSAEIDSMLIGDLGALAVPR